jgi:predicted nucleic acid-binding protein
MRSVFADTYYWIALLNSRDQGHSAARAFSQSLRQATLITTQEVLSEVLTYFCEQGPSLRRTVTAFIRSILNHPRIRVYPQSDQSFLNGLSLYEARPDKGYSLVDCVSMLIMRQGGMTEVLTEDNHFTQEGFIKLL